MNGKKVKALRRAFKESHGRAPVCIADEVERLHFTELPEEVRDDLVRRGRIVNPEVNPVFVKTKPGIRSEMRRLKKGTLTP